MKARPRRDDAPLGDNDIKILFSSWQRARGVLIGVSGGPDSIALLGLAARWRALGGNKTPLLAATFDHALRKESAREARMAKSFSASLGVEHRTLKWSGDKPSSRLQERARGARHAALAALAGRRRCDLIALAHHLDDQAETILMRIAAGTGLDGLSGMSKTATMNGVVLHRPFLDLPKARLVATCEANGWPFVEDPSNADERFARPRWRALTPALAAEGLSAERLAGLAARARRAEQALEAAADAWLAANPPRRAGVATIVPAGAWAAAAQETRLRLLSRLIGREADEVPERLQRLERLEGELFAAFEAKRSLSRNLRGVLVSLDRDRGLRFAPEPPRRRARRSS